MEMVIVVRRDGLRERLAGVLAHELDGSGESMVDDANGLRTRSEPGGASERVIRGERLSGENKDART
jgi:hypothetical protein